MSSLILVFAKVLIIIARLGIFEKKNKKTKHNPALFVLIYTLILVAYWKNVLLLMIRLAIFA